MREAGVEAFAVLLNAALDVRKASRSYIQRLSNQKY